MAKKKPDKYDAVLDALSEDTTPEEMLKDGSILKELQKRIIERALEAEMTNHLGYPKDSPEGHNTGNSRNGRSKKSVTGPEGDFDIETPRDRNGSFEPQLIRKRQVRLEGFDEKVIAFYSRGMTTREIQGQLKEIYGTEVSPSLISKVTDAVLDEVKEWQNRPLDAVFPVVYLDAIHLKIRTSGRVTNRAVYLALGINLEGNKELMGLWIGESEGAKFWLGILNELQNRGVQDILIAAVDGLKGFPDAIESVFPKTEIQLCIVHMIRNSLRYVGWKDRKAVAKDLKTIYTASTTEAAEQAMDAFEAKYGERFPMVIKTWRSRWENVIPFFSYPDPIRKVIYTTNAIESLNAQLRKVTRKRGAFPTDDSVRKVLYLAITKAAQKWKRPIKDWSAALNFFSIVFEGRVPV
jgi:putative transposase